MQFKDQVDFVRQHIKKNKLRVFMTILAATMGTAFLIVLASVGFGIHDTIRSEVLSNRLVNEIQVYASEESGNPEDKIETFKKMNSVKAVVHRQRLTTTQQSNLDGFLGDHELIVTDFIEEGKVGFGLSEGRLPVKENEVVVGFDFAGYLMLDTGLEESDEIKTYEENLIGKQFTFSIGGDDGEIRQEGILLTIVGVGKSPTKDWLQDRSIYVNQTIISEIEHLYNSSMNEEDAQLFSGSINVYADELENVKAVATELKEEGYYVYSISDELEQLDVFFLALKAGLVFVGTIAILISSIGIFNTMTMAVTERTREIGVMKAIGANPKLIRRLFLMESAWIGIVGTVLAVVISYGVSLLSNLILPIIVASALGEEDLGGMEVTFSVIPWQLVVIASVISISVAMISGWRPARKATKIDVIQALRQEL